MSLLDEITTYTDEYLSIHDFQDYCPNGLQVEGRQNLEKIASGVTASLAFIEQAIAWGAECLLVHHGYFWKNEHQRIVGMKKRRLQPLLTNTVSLLAYHLPLDAHPVVGNNVQLAHRLGIESLRPLQKYTKSPIGNIGKLPVPTDAKEFVARCELVRCKPGVQ